MRERCSAGLEATNSHAINLPLKNAPPGREGLNPTMARN